MEARIFIIPSTLSDVLMVKFKRVRSITDMPHIQIRSIAKEIILGKQLQSDLGEEIRDDYVSGQSRKVIVDKYDIIWKYAVGEEIAISAVGCALRGYKGGLNIDPYEGLIQDDSELVRLCREHKIASGELLYQQGRGIHAIRPADMEKLRSKGRQTMYRKRLGIHGRSKKQMSIDGCKSAIARGFTPWIEAGVITKPSEKEVAYELSQRKKYRIQEGYNRGDIDNVLIAAKLNEVFHRGEAIRTSNSVHCVLYQYGKNISKST